jgi:hypothetical protein
VKNVMSAMRALCRPIAGKSDEKCRCGPSPQL